MITARTMLGSGIGRRFRLGYTMLLMITCGVGAGTYAIESSRSADVARPLAVPPPSPAEFARDLVGIANAFGSEHGESMRLADADCVQASPGHYMCSYAVVSPNGARECHIMQARWTPQLASSYTVTLAGRSGRCGSLHEALRSLT